VEGSKQVHKHFQFLLLPLGRDVWRHYGVQLLYSNW